MSRAHSTALRRAVWRSVPSGSGWTLALCLTAAPLAVGAQVATRCADDSTASPAAASAPKAGATEAQAQDPRSQLLQLVDLSARRSRTLGALQLLNLAAQADVAEAQAQQRLPTVNLQASTGLVGQQQNGITTQKGLQHQVGLQASASLWDFGRMAKLTEWRSQLAESARLGHSNAEEQLALQTVSLALDRSRYQLQGQVYQQYARKMACLVDALESITRADKGRASELVQAQKSLQQAELQLEMTQSALRQTEVKLRRFVGDELPPPVSMSAVLTQLPDLAQAQADVASSAEVAQASANAQAQRHYAESVQAGQRPSVSVSFNSTLIGGTQRQRDVGATVHLNVPLLQPGADAALTSAQRRYQAALLQRDETVEAKRYRVMEMHESAASALDRARRSVEILRNSDRVRASTLQQWQQLGRRSLFDVMASEGDYYSTRVSHVNALFDAQQIIALIWSQGRGVLTPLR
ncbi:TolC family protein [Roseateles sp. BYS180W]|uniref:TolC family protein n=1 Tax=Roseateles rivi TaxID=3299028 RepID=A0ABW7FZF7_9BURK